MYRSNNKLPVYSFAVVDSGATTGLLFVYLIASCIRHLIKQYCFDECKFKFSSNVNILLFNKRANVKAQYNN